MKTKLLLSLALLCCLGTPSAFGQSTGQLRIAVANTGRIYSEMQEFKELRENLEAEGVRLRTIEKEKREAIQQLQNQRNQLKADTPQWDDLNNKLMDAAGEFQLWVQQEKMRAERHQKRQVKLMISHIEKAIGEVAQRDGYDLVLADLRPEVSENLDEVNIDRLRATLSSRNVLFATPKIDISDAVIALLDSKHKGKGGGAPAAGGGTPPATRKPAATPAPRQEK